MVALGLSDGLVIRLLACLSLLAFGLILVRGCRKARGYSRGLGARVFAFVCLVGVLPWYGRSSFGEALAAWIILESVMAARAGSRAFVPVFVLAALSKDTALPFLVLLSWAAAYEIPGSVRKRTIGLASAASIAALLTFNLVRYGALRNEFLLDPVFVVSDLATHLKSFLGIWFSPNGGLLVFWPALGVLSSSPSPSAATSGERGRPARTARIELWLWTMVRTFRVGCMGTEVDGAVSSPRARGFSRLHRWATEEIRHLRPGFVTAPESSCAPWARG